MIDIPQLVSVFLILGGTMAVAWLIAPYLTRMYTQGPGRLDRLLNPLRMASID